MNDEVTVVKKEDFDAVLANIAEKINAGKPDMKGYATLSDIQEAIKALKPTKVEATVDGEHVEAVLEESGVFASISNFEVWGIPVAKAAVGGLIAVFASELVDGFLAGKGAVWQGVTKLALSGATVKWGTKFMGKPMAGAIALLLAYDGIRSLLPIDTWATSLSTKVTSKLPSGGLGGAKAMVGAKDVMSQARTVAADYYAKAEGRA